MVEIEPAASANFLQNKLRVADIESERLVFIDANTLILRPLHCMWKNEPAHFLARPAMRFRDESDASWASMPEELHLPYSPYFNSGYFVMNTAEKAELSNK